MQKSRKFLKRFCMLKCHQPWMTLVQDKNRMQTIDTTSKMLYNYVIELKDGVYPWIDQVTQALVPLLKLCFYEEVRRAAVSVMPELLRSTKLVVQKGIAQGKNETYVKQLSDYIIPALVEALYKY